MNMLAILRSSPLNFKSPLKFKRCIIKFLDVTDQNDIQQLIQKYDESKTNHRVINETEQGIKNICN